MKILALVLGLIVSAIGMLGVAAPTLLLDFARSLQTAAALYAVAAIRIAFGTVLILAATGSRLPKTLRVLGALIVIGGLITPFIGVDGSRAMIEWVWDHGSVFMRAWAGVAVALGLFIVYAVAPRRGAS